jgi:hypothetical protein
VNATLAKTEEVIPLAAGDRLRLGRSHVLRVDIGRSDREPHTDEDLFNGPFKCIASLTDSLGAVPEAHRPAFRALLRRTAFAVDEANKLEADLRRRTAEESARSDARRPSLLWADGAVRSSTPSRSAGPYFSVGLVLDLTPGASCAAPTLCVRVASDPVKTLDLGPFAQELAKLRDQYQALRLWPNPPAAVRAATRDEFAELRRSLSRSRSASNGRSGSRILETQLDTAWPEREQLIEKEKEATAAPVAPVQAPGPSRFRPLDRTATGSSSASQRPTPGGGAKAQVTVPDMNLNGTVGHQEFRSLKERGKKCAEWRGPVQPRRVVLDKGKTR